MREPTREEISLALAMIKLRLKKRGDDLETFNPKYLEEKALKLCADWIRDYPDKPMFIKLEGQES